MRIGIDVRSLLTKNYSGVSFYTFNLLRAIFEIDTQNEYLLFYNSSKKFILPDFNRPNVRYIGYSYSNKLFNLVIKLFSWPKVNKLLGGVDILFCPNANFISWSSSCRKIITVHDLSFLRCPKFFSWKMRFWHWTVNFGKILKEADKIIAVSENTKNDIIDLFNISEESISVVYEGVEEKFKLLDVNDSERKRVKEKYSLPDKFLLFLGTIEPRKNLSSVIQAFNSLGGDCSLVVGGGKGWKNRVSRRHSELAVPSHSFSDGLVSGSQPCGCDDSSIKFIGYIDEKDKVAIYNLATALIYPSYYEGFGLPILEAMACGCPVIAGANSSQIEVAGNAGLLVNPYDVNEIKSAMEAILSDNVLKQKMIRCGLEQARCFSWKKTAEQMISLFKN